MNEGKHYSLCVKRQVAKCMWTWCGLFTESDLAYSPNDIFSLRAETPCSLHVVRIARDLRNG